MRRGDAGRSGAVCLFLVCRVFVLHPSELLLLEPDADEGQHEQGKDVVEERAVGGEDDHGEDGGRLDDERVELDVENAELERRRGDVAVRRLVDDKRLVGGDFLEDLAREAQCDGHGVEAGHDEDVLGVDRLEELREREAGRKERREHPRGAVRLHVGLHRDVADVLANDHRERVDERDEVLAVRVHVDLGEVVVQLRQIDQHACDGADAARLELGERLHQEDQHRLELMQHARDVRLDVGGVSVEPRDEPLDGNAQVREQRRDAELLVVEDGVCFIRCGAEEVKLLLEAVVGRDVHGNEHLEDLLVEDVRVGDEQLLAFILGREDELLGR